MRRRKKQPPLSREDKATLLPLSKEELAQRLGNAYRQINRLYQEQDVMLLLLNLLAQHLHLWTGIANNPVPEIGWHYVLVVDLPGGQVYWPIPDEHLPFFREASLYHWPVQFVPADERMERLRKSGLRLYTESDCTEPDLHAYVSTPTDESSAAPLPL